jgi:hypothetical protein
MSNWGILFSTDSVLVPGRPLELSIDWPARLNDRLGLTLVACGQIVHYQRGLAAMEIRRYEFYTRAALAATAGG